MWLCVYGVGGTVLAVYRRPGAMISCWQWDANHRKYTPRVCHFQTIKDQNYIYVCVVVFLKKKKKKKRAEREEAARREKKHPAWRLPPCRFVKCLQLAVRKAGWVERHGRELQPALVATGSRAGAATWNCCLLTELRDTTVDTPWGSNPLSAINRLSDLGTGHFCTTLEFSSMKSAGGCCLVAKLCPTLCEPLDCSLAGSSVHRILQARTLEWVAMTSSGDLPDPEIEPASLKSPALAGATWEALKFG